MSSEKSPVVINRSVWPPPNVNAYYVDESVCLINGDCLDVLPHLEPVDHVITDPPYSDHVHAKQWVAHAMTDDRPRHKTVADREHKALGFAPISSDIRHAIVKEAERLASRWVIVFSDIESANEWKLAFSRLDYVRTCLWIKPDAAPQFTGDRPGAGAEAICVAHREGKKRWNGGGRRGVFTHGINDFGRVERLHPCPKPLPLMVELVTLFTDEGETILDPFAGSGTTGVAAKLNGRRAILIEKNERYCEIAAKRLAETEPGRLFDNVPRAKQIGLLKP